MGWVQLKWLSGRAHRVRPSADGAQTRQQLVERARRYLSVRRCLASMRCCIHGPWCPFLHAACAGRTSAGVVCFHAQAGVHYAIATRRSSACRRAECQSVERSIVTRGLIPATHEACVSLVDRRRSRRSSGCWKHTASVSWSRAMPNRPMYYNL